MTTDELGFDTAHRPGALTRYFAERWLEEPSAKGERLIAWLLEAALGRNTMHFIERTKEYVDAWGGRGEVVPANAFDGFVITGDPVEDTIIPHAILVWTCMNDRPWREDVYHHWLDQLLAAGSAEAAYLAASLWPAHDLMAKVSYRPVRWLIYRGQLDAEADRLILTEMLKGDYGPRTSLYGSFEYDDVRFPWELPEQYIERHGFTHPICGLVGPIELESDSDLRNRIQEALAALSWSEGTKGAAMLLYLSLKAFNDLSKKRELSAIYSEKKLNLSLDLFRNSKSLQGLLNTLEQNLFKLDERHINIINFNMDKVEKIDYNLVKDYISYIITLYNITINERDLLMKIFSKYISIGLRIDNIPYIGSEIKDIIFNLMLKEKEKVESWLEKQADDLRIKDILLAIYINKRIDFPYCCVITTDEELKTEHVEEKIENIYGKIEYFNKIILLIDQARIYSNPKIISYKIYNFIEDILKRNAGLNFNCNFKGDYRKIINSWHMNGEYIREEHMFLKSNHIGLYLYYNILRNWDYTVVDFRSHIKEEKELKLYTETRIKIIENLYRYTINEEIKLNLYLNKIESNNLPYEEIKYELIAELIDIIKNNYKKISEYFIKDENKLRLARKVILSNIDLIKDELRDSRLIELLRIGSKSKSMIIY